MNNKQTRALCIVVILFVAILALFYRCKPVNEPQPAPVTGISTNGVISDQ